MQLELPIDQQKFTFHLSGSKAFNLLLTAFIILLAVKPGFIIFNILYDEFRLQDLGSDNRIQARKSNFLLNFLLNCSLVNISIINSCHLNKYNQINRVNIGMTLYQHKKGPPKMIKDLKFGQGANLRQSLLQFSQIQNLNKIFRGRKDHYKIQTVPIEITKQNQNQVHFQTLVLSPEQTLEQIKKQKLQNKMKDNLSHLYKQKQTRKYKLRKPVIYNLLQDYKKIDKIQEPPKFKQTLKQSQKNLAHIKINNRKRMQTFKYKSSQYIQRQKFISLDTSLPTKNKQFFPTFQNFIEGRLTQIQEPPSGINLDLLENYIDNYLTEPFIRNKRTLKKQNIQQANQSNYGWPQRHPTSQITNKQRVKSCINADTTFINSQNTSKKLIMTMTNYRQTKSCKKKQYDTMVDFLKHDRPLTCKLRRSNYKIVGSNQHLAELKRYRAESQKQRKQLLKKNYQFYISMLKIFEHCKQNEIPFTLKVLERLKKFFESEYLVKSEDINILLKFEQSQDLLSKDFGLSILKQNLQEFANQSQNFYGDQNQFQQLF